jgi:hypothetical protein
MDQEFAWLTILASYPLRHGYEDGPPHGNCSGAIVQCATHRLVLTVSHAVRPAEEWAIELHYEPDSGTKLWKLGPMQYTLSIDGAGLQEVDFAFTTVPTDVEARWQRFSDDGALVEEQGRVVLSSDLSAAPRPGVIYGFAGLTRHTIEPKPPHHPHAIAGAEVRVESGLTYRGMVQGLDHYALGHRHPGNEYYRGCSGAPVLSADGDLVGLVLGGSEADATIYALPLRHYRTALMAAVAPHI